MKDATNRKILVARRNPQLKSEVKSKRKAVNLVKFFEQIRNTVHPEPTGDQLISIRIRYPSGASHILKFELDSSLEELFLATCRHDHCPPYFRLFLNCPKAQIHCAPEWYHQHLIERFCHDRNGQDVYIPAVTFRDAGFPRTAVVMVEDCCA